MTEFVKVAVTSDIPPGKGRSFQLEGKMIALFNVAGTIHAIDNICCHVGGSLGDGTLTEQVVSCPLHGWEYDVTTGKCQTMPDTEVARYEVKIEGDDVLVQQ